MRESRIHDLALQLADTVLPVGDARSQDQVGGIKGRQYKRSPGSLKCSSASR
jgi:hypothetical protein